MMEILSDFMGLIGVLIGGFIVTVIPWIREARQEKRLRAERANYLAVRVTLILDVYIQKCAYIMNDDGTILGQAPHIDEQGFDHYIPVEPEPDGPDFPDDVDWKSIDGALMADILVLPYNNREARAYIAAVSEMEGWPPDYSETHEARYMQYGKLGLEALAITERLRKTYKLRERRIIGDPDSVSKEQFKNKIKSVEEKQAKRREMSARLMPATPSTPLG